jgi:hypothetical protein
MKYLLGLSAVLALGVSAHAASVEWAKDMKSALASAKAKNCLVMIDFDLQGDQFCKKLNDGGLKDPRFEQASKSFVSLRVDPAKDGKPLLKKFGVGVYPCVLFLKPDETVVSRLVGYYAPSDFCDAVDTAVEMPSGVPAAKAKLAKDPGDGEANAKMAVYACAGEDPLSGKEPSGAPYLAKALASKYHGPYLTRALMSVGAAYSQVDGKESEAISDYKKALALSTSPAQSSTALAALIYLYIDKDKPSAMTYAKMLVAMKGASPDWVQVGQDAIKQMNGKE